MAEDPLDTDDLMTARDAGALIRINPLNIRKAAKAGRLPGVRDEDRGWLFKRDDVIEYRKRGERISRERAERELKDKHLIRLSPEEWSELYYALENKKIALEAKHVITTRVAYLDGILEKLGRDGAEAFQSQEKLLDVMKRWSEAGGEEKE